MTGTDDFFGGSITPPNGPTTTGPTGPTPGAPLNPHMALNKEYASYGSATAPVATSSRSRFPLIVGAVVMAVVSTAGFGVFRVLFGGTQIEIPDTLMGLERVDSADPAASQLEQSVEQVKSEVGDVDVEVALFQAPGQMLLVMGGEAGTDDVDGGAADYFAGFEDGLTQSGQAVQLTDVDPGPKGGQMKCLDLPSGGTCAWIGNDTFGAFAMAPLTGSAADTAKQIRDEIEK
jgi:hypothetical protein